MKKLLSILLTLTALIATPSLTSQERPTVAVVLSGGGAKGVAHIGALKVIEEAGIPVDIVCGTSMGALVGGLYVLGYTPAEMDSIVRAQDWTALLSDRIDPDLLNLRQRREQNTYALIRGITSERPQSGGLIRGRNLMQLFHQLCDSRLTYYSPTDSPLDSISFDRFPVRYACVTTDLVTFSEVVFHEGNMLNAMRASMAIPGVFTPVRTKGMVLVDGGLTNNYPADVARAMGADIIIGVNVQNKPRTADELADAAAVMNQIIDMGARRKYEETIALSDIVVKVDVSGYSAASFTRSAIDTLLRRGEEEARRHWDELTALAGGALAGRQSRTQDMGLQNNAILRPPTSEIRHPRPLPTIGIPIARVGFRFDSEEMGALQISGTLPVHSRVPLNLDAVLRFGRRIEAQAAARLFPRGFTSPTIAYTFRRNDLDIYAGGERTYNMLYRQHQVDLTPVNTNLHRFNLRTGLRWDWFDYYGRILSSRTDIPDEVATLSDNHWFSYYALAEQNNENHWYFPSRGNRTTIRLAYVTDNLMGIGDHEGLTELSFNWRINIATSERLSFQPMFYGRMLLGSEVPLSHRTVLGTEWFSGYVEQQMPFEGMHHTEYVERNILAMRLQAQYRLLSNHYLQLRLAVAELTELAWPTAIKADTWLPSTLLGASLAYHYNTFLGPLGATIGYNNRCRKPYLYITLGHKF